MTREEKIQKLTEELLSLVNQPDSPSPEQYNSDLTNNSIKNHATSAEKLSSPEAIVRNLREGLNVDVNVVRQIMKRVDDVYGKADNYIKTKALYESFGDSVDDLLK
jgi:hypothetical protein